MRATGANVRSGEKQLNYGNKGVSDNYNPADSVTDTAYILSGTSSSIIIRESDDQHVPASHNQFNPVGKDELGYRNKGDAGRATLNNSDPAATNFRSGEDNMGYEKRGEGTQPDDMRSTGADVRSGEPQLNYQNKGSSY